MDFPNVQSVQIIFNMFRQRPAELFLTEAKRRKVGVLARVPLASGLLSGRMKPDTNFETSDHRQFNRFGAHFDVGETFSGVEYQTGLLAVEELKTFCPPGWTLTQFALRWILMFDGITCAIPGAKRPEQAAENCAAADLPALSEAAMTAVRRIYDQHVRAQVHNRW
jgi:aryl-alcohol dehydrogenase-like predicted oxidoreductase